MKKKSNDKAIYRMAVNIISTMCLKYFIAHHARNKRKKKKGKEINQKQIYQST